MARSARPGPRTSEFGVTLAVIVCATVLRALRMIADEMWAATVTFVATGYTAARAVVKKK